MGRANFFGLIWETKAKNQQQIISIIKEIGGVAFQMEKAFIRKLMVKNLLHRRSL